MDTGISLLKKKYGLSGRAARVLYEFDRNGGPTDWARAWKESSVVFLREPACGLKTAIEIETFLIKAGLIEKPKTPKRARRTNAKAIAKVSKSRRVIARHVAFLGGKVQWVKPASKVIQERRRRRSKSLSAWKLRRKVEIAKTSAPTQEAPIEAMTAEELREFKARMNMQLASAHSAISENYDVAEIQEHTLEGSKRYGW